MGSQLSLSLDLRILRKLQPPTECHKAEDAATRMSAWIVGALIIRIGLCGFLIIKEIV